MRVLLIKPYQPTVNLVTGPPLGLLYLASSLRERFGESVEVDVLDMTVRGLAPSALPGIFDRTRPDVVGVGAMNLQAGKAAEVARIAKEWRPETLTVFGGPFVHRRAHEALDRGPFDWAFDGESERVFPEALARRMNGEPLGEDLPGLAYRKRDGEVHVAASTDSIPNVDSIPYPAWDLVPFELYTRYPTMNDMRRGRRYATLFTSRGCPYRCAYCHDIFGKRFVHRSPANVLGEIELLIERHGIDEFQIVDDIFNLDKRRAIEIMNEVARRWPGKLFFCFPNGLRSDLLDDEILASLKAAGTYSISVAIETTSPRLQKLTKRHLDLERALWAIDAVDRHGMMVRAFFMLGFPSETEAEMRHTVETAIRSKITLGAFFSAVPQPGTPLYDIAKVVDAKALAEVDEVAGYYSGPAWYEAAHRFPLRRFIRMSYLRLYSSPRRLLRVLRHVPARSLWNGMRQYLSIVAGRDSQIESILPEAVAA